MTIPSANSPEDEPRPPRGEWLRLHRQSRGWSIREMRRHLRDAARASGDNLPGNECLDVMIRRWEKGGGGVSERYRMHYCRAFDLPLDAFGSALPADSSEPQAPASVITMHPRPGTSENDENTELARLRRDHDELSVKYNTLKQTFATWVREAVSI